MNYKILQIMPALNWYARAIDTNFKDDASDWYLVIAWALCEVSVENEPGTWEQVIGVISENQDSPQLVTDCFDVGSIRFEYKYNPE